MITRQVTVREGEYLGPVDWEYDFEQHADLGFFQESMHMFRQIATDDDARWLVTTDGGAPKFGWKPLIRCGMYDGWPFWRPVPSFQYNGTLGPEWHPFYSVTGIEKQA